MNCSRSNQLTFDNLNFAESMLHLVKINGIYERRPVQMPLQITSRKWHHYEFLGYENITALVILAGMEQ